MSNVSLFQTKYTTIENIENLSMKLQEPDWMLNRRKSAFNKFNELPYVQDTLFYKYTNFRKLNPENWLVKSSKIDSNSLLLHIFPFMILSVENY